MNSKKKGLLVGGIGGFLGGGMGAVAGSSTAWINMFVGAFGAVVVIFLINGFISDKK
jgi:hypothetical protein